MQGLRQRSGGFIGHPVVLGSTLDPADDRGMLHLFSCQVVDRTIDMSGIGEDNRRHVFMVGFIFNG